MAYKKGTYKEIKLRRFYSPCFWPGIEECDYLPPDYQFKLEEKSWSEDDIFGLFAQDNSTVLQKSIRDSVRAGTLIPQAKEDSEKHRIGSVYYFSPFVIIDWAIGKKLNIPVELIEWRNQQLNKTAASQINDSDFLHQSEPVANDGVDSQAITEPKQKALTKLEKQQAAILKVIEANEFKPMAIPDGKKTGTIQRVCENDYAVLFNGSTSFDRAWKLGLNSNLWKMENHESYARRGNN